MEDHLFVFALSTGEVIFLKFADNNMENDIPTTKVLRAKTNKTQAFSISHVLYEELIE